MARANTINKPRGGKAIQSRSAVGYVRRSTERQEQSIPDQQRAIERYAEEHGLQLLRFDIDDAIAIKDFFEEEIPMKLNDLWANGWFNTRDGRQFVAVEGVAELALRHAIDPFHLLFFTKLLGVFRYLTAP